MSRVVIKGAEWVLSAERAQGAPDGIYEARCLWCGAESPMVDDDSRPVGMWALDHTRRLGLEHGQFVVTSQRHWRVDPVVPGGEVRRPVGVRSSGAHARPRWGMRRLGRGVARLVVRWAVAMSARWLPALTAGGGQARSGSSTPTRPG
ncbi:DUF7848 domain-containing protein [Streptomyces specialis]|uniref:DUF7848 domain-containing protein n=1 Tax=Streptomyces specialis TaxID=498367 RepID=UPI00073F1700|nr:hypothetical protein [Streptomyces specialis]